MKTVSKTVKIRLNDEYYLLEEGDRIDFLPGGLADKHDVESIAKKHGVSVEFIKKQLEIGIKVELEHTDNEAVAAEIALDHLWEIPDYYTRLEKMEKEAEEEEAEEQTDKSPEMAIADMMDRLGQGEVIAEAAVHRRYILVSCNGEEDRCFSPSSANDNYVLYFLERLCNSKRFNSRSYRVKIVKKIPKGCRKMSLETFLKELIPVPEKE